MPSWIPKIIYNSITLNFTFPPEGDPINERLTARSKKTVSLNGTEQTLWQINEEIITVNFKFLTQTELDSLRTMWDDWGSHGKDIEYFSSNDEAARGTFTIATAIFPPNRVVADGSGDFNYDVTMSFRRTL